MGVFDGQCLKLRLALPRYTPPLSVCLLAAGRHVVILLAPAVAAAAIFLMRLSNAEGGVKLFVSSVPWPEGSYLASLAAFSVNGQGSSLTYRYSEPFNSLVLFSFF